VRAFGLPDPQVPRSHYYEEGCDQEHSRRATGFWRHTMSIDLRHRVHHGPSGATWALDTFPLKEKYASDIKCLMPYARPRRGLTDGVGADVSLFGSIAGAARLDTR